MHVADSPQAMRAWRHLEAGSRRVALVPTMGALHDGHLALIERARSVADLVVVSIFVNPLQFDRPADFDRYPRPIDDDIARCRQHGVEAVYAPTAQAMYPSGFQTHVEPGAMALVLEGAQRPGHFRGVTTVVAKLFNAVEPHAAVFGEKDAQQLAVIRRMVADLDMGIHIVGVPTVREDDGVAMSSRNQRLSADERRAAACIPRALTAVQAAHRAGVVSTLDLVATGRAVVEAEPHARFEHLEIVDADTFASIAEVPRHTAASDRMPVLALIAAWFGDVRLIDNCSL
ncbi:MAG: pantothenate synthetase [Actinomycetota bacterium]|jgi:pantoate--beta-alanine ligase